MPGKGRDSNQHPGSLAPVRGLGATLLRPRLCGPRPDDKRVRGRMGFVLHQPFTLCELDKKMKDCHEQFGQSAPSPLFMLRIEEPAGWISIVGTEDLPQKSSARESAHTLCVTQGLQSLGCQRPAEVAGSNQSVLFFELTAVCFKGATAGHLCEVSK